MRFKVTIEVKKIYDVEFEAEYKKEVERIASRTPTAVVEDGNLKNAETEVIAVEEISDED